MLSPNSFPVYQKFVRLLYETELSDISKKTYEDRLWRLVKLTKQDVDWILVNCTKTMTLVRKNVSEPQTRKALVNSVMTLFKNVHGLQEQKFKAFLKWKKCTEGIHKEAGARYETLEPTQSQIDAHVDWADVIKARDALDKKSIEYLLLCLYTMIPPARADYNKVKIYKNKEPSPQDIEENPNYLVVKNKAQHMVLVFNEFKTSTQLQVRKREPYVKELPKELVKVINASLKANPRKYLITSPITGEPYHLANSYTQYFNRILKNIFGKKTSINMLRHSSALSHQLDDLTPLEKKTLANDMMHSPEMFEAYRYRLPDEKKSKKKQ